MANSSENRNHDAGIPLRPLGRTSLEVSVLGYGASPLGGVFGPADEQEGIRAVRLAIEEGINFFDVSPYYGFTLAEERLGRALAGHREQVILSTKCGRYGAEEFDFSEGRVRRSVEESLRRLRTDHVDLLLAHDVEFGEADRIVEETIPAMRQLQQEGKTHCIGISGYPLGVLMAIAKRVSVDCILSYCRYNLLIQDMNTALAPFAEREGIGLINAAPLHMGMLSPAGPPDWHPAPERVRKAVGEARAFCQERKVSLAQIGLGFCFGYPRVASTLVGIATTEQVRQNVASFRAQTDPELLAEIRAILASGENAVWPSGMPENQDPAAGD